MIFRFAPWAGQVIVNLEALYADPTFKNAIGMVREGRGSIFPSALPLGSVGS